MKKASTYCVAALLAAATIIAAAATIWRCKIKIEAIASCPHEIHGATIAQTIMTMIFVTIIAVLLLGALVCTAFYVSNRSHRKDLEKAVYVDPLTGAPTFAKFKRQLGDAPSPGSLISLDILSFKTIISVCGKERTGQIISSMWQIIESHLKNGEFAARIESDHFVIYLPKEGRQHAIDTISPIAQEIEALADKMGVPRLHVIAGVYHWHSTDDPEVALGCAVAAKREHSQDPDAQNEQVCFYSDVDLARFKREKTMEAHFGNALTNDEFEAWLQPKYNPKTNEIVGAEALVRWCSPDGLLIPPAQFVPLFERNGMICKLDEHMFRKVCQIQATRLSEGKRIFPISVNISRASLLIQNIPERYGAIVQEAGISPSLVPIEITESIAGTAELREAAQKLCDNKFCLHLDDFGAGYSSLESLGSIPFDTLKIDKSLTDTIGKGDKEKILRHAMILAHDLGLSITAEGVEEKEQLEFLSALSCDNVQGFYYSRPVPYESFLTLLSE